MSLSGGLGRRKRLAPTADINVTSLVDVAFVLLIIFMITAPLMQGGVAVELPKAEGRPLSPKEAVFVSVDRSGQIFVDQTRVTYDEFRAAFRALVAKKWLQPSIYREIAGETTETWYGSWPRFRRRASPT